MDISTLGQAKTSAATKRHTEMVLPKRRGVEMLRMTPSRYVQVSFVVCMCVCGCVACAPPTYSGKPTQTCENTCITRRSHRISWLMLCHVFISSNRGYERSKNPGGSVLKSTRTTELRNDSCTQHKYTTTASVHSEQGGACLFPCQRTWKMR